MARIDSLFRRYVARGDVRALGKVFDRSASETLRVAMYFARDPAQAEEWLQETYLIAIERAGSWDSSRPFMPWLLGILKNVARRARSVRTHAPLPEAPLPDTGPAATPAGARGEAVEWAASVSQAVEQLQAPYRAVLILRLEHGLEPAEIARLHGVPPATIRSQIHRGLEQLRARLPQSRRPEVLASLAIPLGLDAIRGQVLASARAAAPVVTSGAVLVGTSFMGGLVMSKALGLALAAATLLLVILDPLGFWSNASEESPGSGTGNSEESAARGTGQDAMPPSNAEGDAPGLKGRTAEAHVGAEPEMGPGPDVDLAQVDRKRDLHGVVVLKDGRPVAGALVRIDDRPWKFLMTQGALQTEWVELARTRTGPRGTFALRLQEGDHGRLLVDAPGYASRRILSVTAGERVRIVLDRSVSLLLRVVAPDGAPAAAVPIRLWGAGTPERVTTDAAGLALVEGLDPGETVMFWPQPQREGWGATGLVPRVTLLAEGTQEHLLKLPSGRTIRGVVLDRATQTPIPEAVVGMGWMLEPKVRTDERGAYTLHGWTGRGVREVAVRAPGYITLKSPPDQASDILDFELTKGASVSGRVLDAAQVPIPAALVSIVGSVREDSKQRITVASGHTNAEGRFQLDGLARDLALSICVRARGHGRRMVDIDAVPTGAREVGDIVLVPPIRLEGRVLHQDGTPAARMEVNVKGVNDDRAQRRDSKRPAHESHYGTLETVTTDDLGRFTVADLCPTVYTITCQQPQGPTAEISVKLAIGAQPTPVTLVLPGTRTLRIRVLDPEGEPATGGEVSARHRGKRIRAPLDANGEARLELPDEVQTVQLRMFEESALLGLGRIQIPQDSDELVIQQRRADTIRGVVLEPDGTPLGGALVQGRAQVSGRAGGALQRHAMTDEAGTFELRCAPGESLDLVVQGQVLQADGTQSTQPFFGEQKGVRAGTSEVRIQTSSLVGNETLQILVVDPEGAPLAGIRLLLQPPNPGGGPNKTDLKGRAEFAGLSSLKRVLWAWGTLKEPGRWARTTLEVTPGGPLLTITMQGHASIPGHLLKPDGTPAAGVVLHAYSLADAPVDLGAGYTTKDGRFLVRVPASTSALRLTASQTIDGVQLELDLVLDALPSEPLELHMTPKER